MWLPLPSAAMQETFLKVIHRAYLSPAQRKYTVPEEMGNCKKCGVNNATFFHCIWECGKIRRFWNNLINYINTTFSLQLLKLPGPCLLLNFEKWDLGPQCRSLQPLLSVILTIAKQCILYHWIEKTPPFLHEVRLRLLNTLYYERQRAFPDIEKGVLWF